MWSVCPVKELWPVQSVVLSPAGDCCDTLQQYFRENYQHWIVLWYTQAIIINIIIIMIIITEKHIYKK